jgi:hypothetical protein
VDKYDNAVISKTTSLWRYFEPATAQCRIAGFGQKNIACSGISKPPYLAQNEEKDRTLIVFMTARCAAWWSDFDDYIQLGDDEYLPLGSICKPIAPGIECFGKEKLGIVER